MDSTQNKVAGKIIRRKKAETTTLLDLGDARERRLTAHYDRQQQFPSLPDRLAQSSLFRRNWYYPRGKESFPNSRDLWYVSRYYPDAIGGPLCIDECPNEAEAILCAPKAEILKQAGLRYVLLKPGRLESDIFDELDGRSVA